MRVWLRGFFMGEFAMHDEPADSLSFCLVKAQLFIGQPILNNPTVCDTIQTIASRRHPLGDWATAWPFFRPFSRAALAHVVTIRSRFDLSLSPLSLVRPRVSPH